MELDLSVLATEKQNKQTENVDQLSTRDILTVMNQEDQLVAHAVKACLPEIEVATEIIYHSLQQGGRLFYIGAGTSGRLGVIDASECPPTFRTDPSLVRGIMAGGNQAITTAVEGVEDDKDAGVTDLKQAQFTEQDVLVGIAASGRTPYVIGALTYARSIGAQTIALAANPHSEIGVIANCKIEVEVGPEVLTGSTRLKAATAHKMILNMLSTAAMIKLGKVYGNLMVDVKASNHKLKQRAITIVMQITNVSLEHAEATLQKADYNVKVAIVMIEGNVTPEQAIDLLNQAKGFVRQAIKLVKR
ncbi:LOW QUALITY PROTEIN: N-acetylmuramic acid 6-phosphate etherase [Bacillus sp. JCM 19045]|nr:LOW QUALITY PROTEIN: N-acetylmuramic acid 6-phosphate etherase [Bacillus sp. JCM 19045]